MEIRPIERAPLPRVDAPGLFSAEIAELALVLAGASDEECIATLKLVNADLADTGLAVDFLVAVLKRKFELESVAMTSRSQ